MRLKCRRSEEGAPTLAVSVHADLSWSYAHLRDVAPSHKGRDQMGWDYNLTIFNRIGKESTSKIEQ